MFYVCCVCPDLGTPLPPGYTLTKAERETLCSRMVGIPITVQHHGIKTTVARMSNTKLIQPAELVRAVDAAGGIVISAWLTPTGAVMALFSIPDGCGRVHMLIQSGHLGCVSLTHMENVLLPLELSLCTVPARPNSRIVHVASTLQNAFKYKAACEAAGTSTPNMDTTTSQSTSALELILAALAPDARKLVEARFSEMMTAVTEARDKEQAAMRAKDKMAEITTVDKKLLNHHLAHLMTLIPNTTKDMYCMNTESTFDALAQAPPGVLHSVSNLIKCASHAMAQTQQHTGRQPAEPMLGGSTETAKRSREPDPANDSGAEMTPLQKALADQFR